MAACSAAMPDAVATPASAPSNSATARSSISRLLFELRQIERPASTKDISRLKEGVKFAPECELAIALERNDQIGFLQRLATHRLGGVAWNGHGLIGRVTLAKADRCKDGRASQDVGNCLSEHFCLWGSSLRMDMGVWSSQVHTAVDLPLPARSSAWHAEPTLGVRLRLWC